MLKRYKWQPHDQCPRCLQEKEDTRHVLQCTGEGVQDMWESKLTALSKWMSDNKIHSELNLMISHYTKAWIQQVQPTFIPSNHLLNKAIKQQNQIGWFQFILGFWSSNIVHCQQEYMEETINRLCLLVEKMSKQEENEQNEDYI